MVRFQHVANGTSTTGLIQQAGIPGALSIWADVLNEGPVPVGLTDDELLAVRARFLASPDEPSETVAEGLRRWRRVVDSEADYDELVLWYEHDLFDQLNLIQVLSRIADRPRAKRVSLVSIGSYPGRPAFKGPGELTPDELRPPLHTRETVGHPHVGLPVKDL